jgi:hypothetical protein
VLQVVLGGAEYHLGGEHPDEGTAGYAFCAARQRLVFDRILARVFAVLGDKRRLGEDSSSSFASNARAVSSAQFRL